MNKLKIRGKYIILAGIIGALLFSAGLGAAQTVQKSRLQQLQQAAQNRAKQLETQIKQKRVQAQAKVQELKEEVKQKIGQIKDDAKKAAAEKIVSQFDRINQVWTDHFANVLTHLDAILQKIQSRAEKALKNGQNVSEVNSAIAKARSAIATARTAISAQAQKTYTVDLSAAGQNDQGALVSNLREQFKTLKGQLFADLTALRDGAMKDARVAVQEALQKLSKIPNVDKEPAENSTNQQ